MKTKIEIMEDKSFSVKSAEELQQKADKEGRVLTADEQKSFDSHLQAADNADLQLHEIEESEKRYAKLAEKKSELSARNARRTAPQSVDAEPRSFPNVEVTAPRQRMGGLRAFTNDAKGEEAAYQSGMWLLAMNGNRKGARYCQEHGIEIRDALSNSQVEGTSTLGQTLVPTPLAATIIALTEQYGLARKYARVQPMSAKTLDIPVVTSWMSPSYVTEANSMSNSDKSFSKVTLTAAKLGLLVPVSSELTDDSIINVMDVLARDVAIGYAKAEDTALFVSDSQFKGITYHAGQASHAQGQVQASHATYDTLTVADLSALMGQIPQYALQGAAFYCSQFAYANTFLRLAMTSAGNTVFTMSGGLGPNWAGYPVRVSQVLDATPGTISTGGAMIIFGDISLACILGIRNGLEAVIDRSRFLEYDAIGFRTTERIAVDTSLALGGAYGATTVKGPVAVLCAGTNGWSGFSGFSGNAN